MMLPTLLNVIAIPKASSTGAGLRKTATPRGGELWTRQFAASSSDRASGIAVDPPGVYVAGRRGLMPLWRNYFVVDEGPLGAIIGRLMNKTMCPSHASSTYCRCSRSKSFSPT